jgi:hypothetical protein
MLLGAAIVLVALFLTWSHQGAAVPPGVPRAPTAWQVYSAADVCLALLAAALLAVAFAGARRARLAVLPPVAIAIAFVVHAGADPPTSGAFRTGVHIAAGAGETVALAGLAMALAGLLLSFTAD